MSAEKREVRSRAAAKNPRRPGSMAPRHWFAVILSGCALAAVACWSGIFSHLGSDSSISRAAPDDASSALSLERAPIRWCKRLEFDNEHGRVLESKVPCDGEVLGANGDPIPTGTTNRLNAISRSFSGR